jgi:hypothetical protein
MENDSHAPLCDTYEDFDIHSLESEVKAQRQIDEMSGDFDETPDEDANVPDVMPLPAAVTLVETSHADGFQFMKDIAEQMFAQFSAKAEDVRATQDSRTLHASMALGIKKLLIEWGARVAEAEERLKQSTNEERRLLGLDVSEILEPAEPEVESRSTSSVVGPPSAGVVRNTKRAQEFLAKK